MLVKAFDGEFGIEPILLALGVVADVGVSHGRQFTGGVLRGVSGGVGAIDDDLGVLVGQQRGCQGLDLIGREIFRRRDVRVVVCSFGKRLDEREVLALVQFGPEFVAADGLDRSVHRNTSHFREYMPASARPQLQQLPSCAVLANLGWLVHACSILT